MLASFSVLTAVLDTSITTIFETDWAPNSYTANSTDHIHSRILPIRNETSTFTALRITQSSRIDIRDILRLYKLALNNSRVQFICYLFHSVRPSTWIYYVPVVAYESHSARAGQHNAAFSFRDLLGISASEPIRTHTDILRKQPIGHRPASALPFSS